MCRIFFSPSKTSTFIQKDLIDFFLSLEKSGGGDGNGIFSFKDNNLNKSVKYTPCLCKPEGMFLFHTRKATNGYIRDYNCQPFVGERFIVVHNGIFSSIETFARLLGFPWSADKYSDSYMIHWVLEKIGIFNFYTAFKKKSYGVILVYDNNLKQMFLLKTSGLFTWAKFESSEDIIYGTEKLDYWKIEGKPEGFSSGLYKLNNSNFTTVYEPKIITYYGSYNGCDNNTYGRDRRWWESKDNELCAFCGNWFSVYEPKYKHGNFWICGGCHEKEHRTQELKTPKVCIGCNWLDKGVCWFGGMERDKFAILTDLSKEKTICNTKDDIVAIIANCDICGKTLENADSWSISMGTILCKKCGDKIDEIKKSMKEGDIEVVEACDTCFFYKRTMKIEPCLSCIGKESGEYEHWTDTIEGTNLTQKKGELPVEDRDCENCKFQKNSQDDEPCLSCVHFGRTQYSKWEEKMDILEQRGFEIAYELSAERKIASEYKDIRTPSEQVKDIIDNSFGKCWYCGYHFEDTETPLNDKKGHLVCYECFDDHELIYDQRLL